MYRSKQKKQKIYCYQYSYRSLCFFDYWLEAVPYITGVSCATFLKFNTCKIAGFYKEVYLFSSEQLGKATDISKDIEVVKHSLGGSAQQEGRESKLDDSAFIV